MYHLLDIDIERLEVIILNLIPAFISFALLIYILLFFSKNKTNIVFGIFLVVVGLWQLSAGLTRDCIYADAASIWYRLSLMSIIFVVPLGLFFSLLILNWQKKTIYNIVTYTQFIPAILFVLLLSIKLDSYTIVSSERWRWIVDPHPSFVTLSIYIWLSLSSIFAVGVLWYTYFKSKSNSIKSSQVLLLAIGLSFPIVGGILTEFVYPLVLKIDGVPITGTFFTFFTISSVIAIKKYQLLEYSPKHHWDDIVERMNEGIVILNKKDEIMFANLTFCKQTGYDFEEIKGKNATALFLIGTNQKETFSSIVDSSNQSGSKEKETQLRTSNGEYIWVSISGSPYLNKTKKTVGYIGIQTNITERKLSEEKLLKFNRLYSVLSFINQMIVRSNKEQDLFNETCKIATSYGKFPFVWIGLLNEETKKVELAAESNATDEDLEYFSNFYYKDNGPISIVIQTGSYFVINDFESLSKDSKCRKCAKSHNFNSAIFLPIKKGGKTIGTFILFSYEANFFDKEEIDLLAEISGDISFALEVIDKETQRTLFEKNLKHSKHRLKEAQAIAHVGSWELNFSTGIATFSDEACRIYGLPIEQNKLPFKSWLDFIHPDDSHEVINALKEKESSLGDSAFYHRILLNDGTIKYTYSKTQFEIDANGRPVGLMGIVQDVTELKLAEQKKEFDKNNLSALINNTNDLMWSVGIDKHLITSNIAFDSLVKFISGDAGLESVNNLEKLNAYQINRWGTYYNKALAGETFTIIEHIETPYENWFEISFYPIRKEKNVIGTACYSRNITEKKKSEAEIMKLNHELENRVIHRTVELAKANVQLEEKANMLINASKLIEQKNRDTIDSLNYAKIIQNSTVNKKGILFKHFSESFIINMPLNIVSGDFVRVDEKDNRILIALADCTGHGIPGALITMIGYSFFNDVINYKHKIIPSEVLHALDTEFLHITNEALEINDGMDVGFCSIDISKMELKFAGAHRPLYVLRDNSLIEIKGDNLSIGGKAMENKKYTNNNIKLKKNDAIYLFSDGFTDQFGGEKGKKYSSKRFKNTLLSIQDLNMEEQEIYLKKTIFDWKGNLDQVDDICILGIKI